MFRKSVQMFFRSSFSVMVSEKNSCIDLHKNATYGLLKEMSDTPSQKTLSITMIGIFPLFVR